MISKQKLIDMIAVFSNAHNNSAISTTIILQQLNDIENQYAPVIDDTSFSSSSNSSSDNSDNLLSTEDIFNAIPSSQNGFSLDASELADQNMLLNDTDAEDFSNQLLAALRQAPTNDSASSASDSSSNFNDSSSDSASSSSSDDSSSDSDSDTSSENSNNDAIEEVVMITSAHVAAAFGRLDVLKELVRDTSVDISLPYTADNIKVNVKDGLGVNLLHIATIFGHTELVEFLLLNSVDIFARQEFGWLSVVENQLDFRNNLEHAAQLQNLPQFIKDILLERGDIPNDDDSDVRTFNYADYRTAEFEATIHGYYEILEMLLFVKQYIPYIEQKLDIQPIHAAAMRGNLRSFNMLVAAGANKNANDTHHLTPFILAAESTSEASIALFRALLDDEQIDPNEWGDDGINVFRMLLQHHNLEKLKYLLAHPRFDITKQEDYHLEQILIEVYYYIDSATDRYELMSSAWAKIFATNNAIPIYLPVTQAEYQQHNLQNELPLLHSLASMGYAEVLEDLITYIKHHTTINLQEALHTKVDHKTPLDYAVSSADPQSNANQNRVATVTLLLQHRANPDDLVPHNLPPYMQGLASYFLARPVTIQSTISDAEQSVLETAIATILPELVTVPPEASLIDLLTQDGMQSDYVETSSTLLQTASNQSGSPLTNFLAQSDTHTDRAGTSATSSNIASIQPGPLRRRYSDMKESDNITEIPSTTMSEHERQTTAASDLPIQQPSKRARRGSGLFDSAETAAPPSQMNTTDSPAVVTPYAGSSPTN